MSTSIRKFWMATARRCRRSKGNGVDPLDIISKFGTDALRFGLAYMATETQDVRMPVEFECPHCQKLVEQTQKNRTQPRVECPHCKQPFSTQWAAKPEDIALPRAAVVSERFELARNFCNKLWNASRFALLNLEGYSQESAGRERQGSVKELAVEDQWILSRLEYRHGAIHRGAGAIQIRRCRAAAVRLRLGRVLQFLFGNEQNAAAGSKHAADGAADFGAHAGYDFAAACIRCRRLLPRMFGSG